MGTVCFTFFSTMDDLCFLFVGNKNARLKYVQSNLAGHRRRRETAPGCPPSAPTQITGERGCAGAAALETAMCPPGKRSLRLLEGFIPDLESSPGRWEAASARVGLPRAGHGRPAPFPRPLPRPPLPPLGRPSGSQLRPPPSWAPFLLAPAHVSFPGCRLGTPPVLGPGPFSSPGPPPSRAAPPLRRRVPAPVPSLPAPPGCGSWTPVPAVAALLLCDSIK